MPQISAYGAINGANLKRANIQDRDVGFSVVGYNQGGTSNGNAYGTLNILYDENSGYLSAKIVSGNIYTRDAGDGQERSELKFRFDFIQGIQLVKQGTTGNSGISGVPDTFTGTVPDYVETVRVNVSIATFSVDSALIGEGEVYVTL